MFFDLGHLNPVENIKAKKQQKTWFWCDLVKKQKLAPAFSMGTKFSGQFLRVVRDLWSEVTRETLLWLKGGLEKKNVLSLKLLSPAC